MAFNSLAYLAFLSVVVTLYWLVPVRLRGGLVFAASVAFYALWNVVFAWLPLLIAAIVFACGKLMAGQAHAAKRWAAGGIAFLLALLIAFKYRIFLFDMFAGSAGGNGGSLTARVIFPVGISFYTFEAIAFLVDVRQGRVKMPGFVRLCLFFYFWPNILSGPIVRARELMPQLELNKPFEPRFVFEGLDRMVWGLVQKNVIANLLGIWVDRGFSAELPERLSALDGWFVAIAFGLQIYFDFAGYTNMAIGAGRLIGVTLPENFRQPYHAATPADFWNRWHMTLSRWIRDYLFFPINARWKGAPGPLYASLIGVMALVGLWHGAGWGFLLWGTLHGMYLAGYRAYESFKQGGTAASARSWHSWLWRAATLVAVVLAWVPFRAPSLSSATAMWSAMFSHFGGEQAKFSGLFYGFTMVVALFCAIEPALMNVLAEAEEASEGEGLSLFRIVVRPVAYLFGFFLFLLFDQNYSQFIYSQF